jgi:hypothetical protein
MLLELDPGMVRFLNSRGGTALHHLCVTQKTYKSDELDMLQAIVDRDNTVLLIRDSSGYTHFIMPALRI